MVGSFNRRLFKGGAGVFGDAVNGADGEPIGEDFRSEYNSVSDGNWARLLDHLSDESAGISSEKCGDPASSYAYWE